MKLYTIFKQSLKAIFTNKGRSFLTTLGIVIGIGSVIALISLGTGVKSSISDQISTLGTTNITIMPGAGFGGDSSNTGEAQSGHPGGGPPSFALTASTLTKADLESLSDSSKHPQIKLVTGEISASSIFKSSSGDQRYTIIGTSDSYADIQHLDADKGIFFSQQAVASSAKVIVLGSQLSSDLFGDNNPVGKSLILEGMDYEIIGVLNEADANGFTNPNSQAYIPYTAASETFKAENFNSLTVQAESESAIAAVKEDIQATLLANHNITDASLADFSVSSSADLLSTMNGITDMLTSLLAGIAAISLVVGGIGIMNIMLVSVTERTREIGLRKAVGAKMSDILGQFIMEAVLLTLSGGILGIGLGILVGKVIEPAIGFAPIVTSGAILLAVGVSSIVGLLFGVYPAAKASRLNPIDALRYE
ncbi:MAG: ABC transporter permease [Bacillota bacterium]|nr:ABC transporter permease [Bacillota bacterium]